MIFSEKYYIHLLNHNKIQRKNIVREIFIFQREEKEVEEEINVCNTIFIHNKWTRCTVKFKWYEREEHHSHDFVPLKCKIIPITELRTVSHRHSPVPYTLCAILFENMWCSTVYKMIKIKWWCMFSSIYVNSEITYSLRNWMMIWMCLMYIG